MGRYDNLYQVMGLLQGAWSTANQLKNQAEATAVSRLNAETGRYQAETGRYQVEQQARQFDEDAEFSKEARDWGRRFAETGAKQSAEFKVAEDEAKRLYKDWGTVKSTLNPDGYTFSFSPAKMEEWEYKKMKESSKLNAGGYNQPKSNEPKIGQIVNGHVYMGNSQWTPVEENINIPEQKSDKSNFDFASWIRQNWNTLSTNDQSYIARTQGVDLQSFPWRNKKISLIADQQKRIDSDNIYSDLPPWNPNAESAGVETRNPNGKALLGGYVAMGSVANPWLLSLFPFGKGGK